ncbi:MAG: DNA polymerase III subunit delta' [Gammaproteobacteria bacterium]|nr:DNA polymerase III subunit delta' [Gammaproteobacteria bacterium]
MNPYPWQQAQWDALTTMWQKREMPHGIVLRGPADTGKRHFAAALAQAMMCGELETGAIPCGKCRGCRLYLAGTHPDARLVAPEEGSRGIVVDQIRDIVAFSTLSRHTADTKVCIVAPAEGMNATAQNNLLKTLEEPPGPMVFLLINHLGGELLATIRSRCQIVSMPAPAEEAVSEWLVSQGAEHGEIGNLLALAGGAPLRAKALLESGARNAKTLTLDECVALIVGQADPVGTASRWLKSSTVDETIERCLEVLQDIARRKMGVEINYRKVDAVAVHEIPFPALYALYDKCVGLRREMRGNLGRNEQLALESLAYRLAGLGRRRSNTNAQARVS